MKENTYFCKDTLGVQEPRIDMLGRFETAADDENFSGDVTRRRRLGRLDLVEKLVEDP